MIKTEGQISLDRISDFPPMPFSFGLIDGNRTGTWKYVQPVYEDKLAPCNESCPAGNDIAKWMDFVARGEEDKAYAISRSAHPFAATLGRVCPHPCQDKCNRAYLGGEIQIHGIERYLGDCAVADGFRPKRPAVKDRKDGKIAVVGSGPAGLTAAYRLGLMGHNVDVFEARGQPGGYLRYGIPSYRLPRSVLDAEIALVEQAGARIKTGKALGRELTWSRLESYDAVLLAIGFHKSSKLNLPGDDLPGVHSGIDLLGRIADGRKVKIGRRVAVIGGGNTAMDVARSLLRKGCQVTVYYRRTRHEMPAISSEVDEAIDEGIPIEFLTAPADIRKRGQGLRLTLQRMKLGQPDESGRRRPVPIRGKTFAVNLDAVVTAIGEQADLNVLPDGVQKTSWGLSVDLNLSASRRGLFGAGDAATGMGTVTHAVGDGRRAAEAIARFLSGKLKGEGKAIPPTWDLIERPHSSAVVRFENLNTAYFREELPIAETSLAPTARIKGFREVVRTFSVAEARAEANRCFKCGTCNRCENCLVFCPDVSILRRPGDEYPYFEVDLDHCKGCGVCVTECPRNALSLKEVS